MYYGVNGAEVPEWADKNETYGAALALVVDKYFPVTDGAVEISIGEQDERIMRNIRLGKIIHNVIFGAGVRAPLEEWPQNGSGKKYPVVRAEDFNLDYAEKIISNYADQIIELVADEI